MKHLHRLLILSSATIFALVAGPTVLAQNTAFSYQGRLNDNGVAASGSYDFQFTIYPMPNGSSPVSPSIPANGVLVTNGLFNLTLDFGDGVFTGAPRWLQIEVRRAGTPGPFLPLTPRQPIAPAPYALYSARANQAASVPWAGVSSVALGGGLSLGTGNTIGIRFGTAPDTAAPGDHIHFGQDWAGNLGGLYGLKVNNTGPGGGGLFGYASALTGLSIGLRGDSDSTAGIGVFGRATATSGNTFGVQGLAASTTGTGVAGVHQALTGTTPGVEGETASTSGSAAGVIGRVSALAAGGFSSGVRGINQSTNGNGIGVYGSQNGSGYGLYGTTPRGTGVVGNSTSGDGVVGSSVSGEGVVGSSSTGAALSAAGNGVIRSTAESDIFFPATIFRLNWTSLSRIETTGYPDGSATYRGYDDGFFHPRAANVVIPMVLPGVLYGQSVTLKSLTIFYHTPTPSNSVSGVWVRRPIGPDYNSETLLEDLAIHNAVTTTNYTNFTVNFPQATTLTHDKGLIACYIHLDLPDTTVSLTLFGARLTIGH